MVRAADVSTVQRCYPQIYLACHVDHVRRESTPYGLTAHESSLLAHLDRNEPRTARQLATHLGVAASTLSAALKRLEQAGFVHRETAPDDHRVALLRLTKQGERALSATSVLDADRVRAVLETLDETARAEALRGLGLLAAGARQWLEENRSAKGIKHGK